MTVLVDSVIQIHHFNGRPEATGYIRKAHFELAISAVTRAEVLTGFERPQVEVAARLLDRFPLLPLTKETADLAAGLRRKHKWKLPDAFQAALAHIHGLKLATRNTKDFPPAEFAFVVVPY